jgi:hypothetical protein
VIRVSPHREATCARGNLLAFFSNKLWLLNAEQLQTGKSEEGCRALAELGLPSMTMRNR